MGGGGEQEKVDFLPFEFVEEEVEKWERERERRAAAT